MIILRIAPHCSSTVHSERVLKKPECTGTGATSNVTARGWPETLGGQTGTLEESGKVVAVSRI